MPGRDLPGSANDSDKLRLCVIHTFILTQVHTGALFGEVIGIFCPVHYTVNYDDHGLISADTRCVDKEHQTYAFTISIIYVSKLDWVTSVFLISDIMPFFLLSRWSIERNLLCNV